MTTEQKEAVALVKDFTKMDFNNPMGWTGYYDTELKELQQAIETVLNLIQEKDKEIEQYKKLYQKALDDAVVTAHYNMQKDKQIDILMNTNNEELDCFIPTDFMIHKVITRAYDTTNELVKDIMDLDILYNNVIKAFSNYINELNKEE